MRFADRLSGLSLSTRLTFVMVSLVLLTAAAVIIPAFTVLEGVALPRNLDRLEAHAKLLANEIERNYRMARADVLTSRSAAALDGIVRAHYNDGIDPMDGVTEVVWRKRMASRFAAELAHKVGYQQFRIIGIVDNGREIVRVDRSGPGGAVRVVPQDELRQKGDTDYFKKTVGLSDGEVAVSRLDLNREDGKVELPAVPVLRVSTPIHGPDGAVFGVLVINVDMRAAFNRIRQAGKGVGIYVVNDEGDYLMHSDPAREFAFERGTPIRIQDDYAGLAGALGAGEDSRRLFVGSGHERISFGIAPVQWKTGPWIAVIETASYAAIMSGILAVREATLWAVAAALLGAIGLAVLVSRSLTRPLVEMTRAVDGFGGDTDASIPVHAGGEIGMLARSFTRMTKEVKDKTVALRQEIAQRRRIFDKSVDLILVVDRQGTYVDVSPSSQAILGYAPAELVGRNAAEFILPEDLANTRAEMREARRANHTRNFECRYVRNDGRVVDLQWTGVWAEQEQQFFFIGRDISERKRTERLKDEFVSTVSHELRTPLTSIAASLGLLTAGSAVKLPDSAARLIKIAHTNSQRLVRLINDILDIEKLEFGKVIFDLKRTELQALTEQAIEANRGFAGNYGVSVALADDTVTCDVRVDADRMTQVVTNLLSNAIKFSPRDGEVSVGIARSGDHVRLSVRDHGPGIPLEFRPRVFEKFAQADNTDTRQKGGTGLGLSIVEQIVGRFEGEVSFDDAPGGGTVFHVDLPALKDEPALDLGAVLTAGDGHLLICEDMGLVAQALARELSREGFTADIATSGFEALRRAATTRYAAILIDLRLPDCDGISLIQQLREQPTTAETPIVVVSADPDRGRDDRRSSSLDVLDWFQKPVDVASLVRVLDRPDVRASGRPRILHVDDDPDVLRFVADALSPSADVVSADSVAAARAALAAHRFDLAVIDIALAAGSGLDLLPDLRDAGGLAIPVIVFSGQGANPTCAAQVQAALTKSYASIDHLVAMLRRRVAGRSARVPEEEVA